MTCAFNEKTLEFKTRRGFSGENISYIVHVTSVLLVIHLSIPAGQNIKQALRNLSNPLSSGKDGILSFREIVIF